MKKDTTQPPTEKPMEKIKEAVEAGILPGKKDHLQETLYDFAIKNTSKKEATVIVFDDEYVTISISPVSKKVLKVGDRVKNAIKAMLKEGYTVKIENLSQPELQF